jgi:predicted MFS family arabinose efflux permease
MRLARQRLSDAAVASNPPVRHNTGCRVYHSPEGTPVSIRLQLTLFFLATIAMGAGLGVHESIFNNFLDDTFHLDANDRGQLEFPRELPGLLVVLFSGLLSTLAVTRVGLTGALVFALGMTGLAFFGGATWSMMIVMMLIGSAGMHLIQPVGSTIAIALSTHETRGRRMGQMGAVRTIGTVLGAGMVWLLFEKGLSSYLPWFLAAAAAGILAGCFFLFMHIPHLHAPRSRLVIRRRYSLYYMLEFLFGARKQIFITFGPWVLIRIYEHSASDIARLLMIGAIIGVVFKPLSGMAIDRFGERAVLITDGMLLTFVCIGYGYALPLTGGNMENAALLASCCFIADNMLFALGAGRAVYLSRLTHSHQEINATLSMGISINHIASMVIPMIAGAVWVAYGFERVFAAAAVFAVFIGLMAILVPGRNTPPAPAG